MTSPPLDIYQDPEIRRGVQLYCELLLAHAARISAKLEELYRRVPASAPMLSTVPPEARLRQNVANIAQATQNGNWGPWLESLQARGKAYARAGLSVSGWMDVFQRLQSWMIDFIHETSAGDPERARLTLKGSNSLNDTAIRVIGQTFVDAHAEIIREQEVALRKLSTPVLTVGDRVLLVPLIGDLDEGRIGQLQREVLSSIRAQRAKVVVLDVTGVAHVDTVVAQRLGACIRAARLMGAQVMVSGFSSEIAQAMVMLGIALPGAETFTALEGALAAAMGLDQERA